MEKTKILMVCLGNICRSPLAEGILKSKLNSDYIEIDSAGTGHWHVGEKPDPRSIAVARKHGIDITSQRARQFTSADFDRFDIIYAMDASNLSNIQSLAIDVSDRQKVKLLLEENPNSNVKDVPDPYHDTDDGFEKVFQLIEEACQQIATRMTSS